MTMAKEKVKCENCEKLFRDRYNLWRHFKRKHYSEKSKDNKPKADKPKPTCSLCGKVFCKNGNLKRHSNFCKKLKSKEFEEFTFNSVSEFENWKKKIEIQTNARFVRKSHYKLQTGSFRTKFSCHRSGFFKPQGKNLRRLKVSGSNKINAICPAKIISISSSEGKIQVSFFSQHNGHSMEIERISLSKSERAEIAEKIARKMSFKEILRSIKNSAKKSDLKRIHLITKKDLHNIEKEFKINDLAPFTESNMTIQSFLDHASNEVSHQQDAFTPTDRPSSNLQLIPFQMLPPQDVEPSNIPTCETIHPPEIQPTQEEQQSIFIVEVPCTVNSVQEPFPMEEIPHKEQSSLQRLKEEMRRGFEQVLSSIQNEEQALNGKNWLCSFHAFVHSTHFPIQLVTTQVPSNEI